MKKDDQQLGIPETAYKATKAVILAISNPISGMYAYATDTLEFGFYNGAAWVWLAAGVATHDHTTADGTGPLTNDEHDGFSEYAEIEVPSNSAEGKIRLYAFDTPARTFLETISSEGLSLRLARDNVVIARGNEAGGITRGKAVYISGATGNYPQIKYAQSNNTGTMPALGIAFEDINDNAYGLVMIQGRMTHIDTSMFAEGDRIFVSPSIPGDITNIEPIFPNIIQNMGLVATSNVSGEIIITPSIIREPHAKKHELGESDQIDVTGLTGIPTSHTELADIGINTHTEIDTHITSHAIRHEAGGADEIDATGLVGVPTSHTELADIGTNTHAEIDAFITGSAIAYGARVMRGSNQTISNNSLTAVIFTSGTFNDGGMWNVSVNPTRLTCISAGWYLFTANIRFTGGAASNRRVEIWLNGTSSIAHEFLDVTLDTSFRVTCTTLYKLAVNDYVECYVYQNTGGDLACQYIANYSPVFSAVKVAPP